MEFDRDSRSRFVPRGHLFVDFKLRTRLTLECQTRSLKLLFGELQCDHRRRHRTQACGFDLSDLNHGLLDSSIKLNKHITGFHSVSGSDDNLNDWHAHC
jgi:hypothetical protein